jgi:SpoVK/Ycf46/Vps4 family AAA+-type ATPase
VFRRTVDNPDNLDVGKFKRILPDSFGNSGFIDPIFLETVVSHIVKNKLNVLGQALFLGIQGPPGEGKSYQLRQTLSKYQIAIFHLSGSSLSGRHEGESITAISDAYRAASIFVKLNGGYAAIVVDDFDLGSAARRDRTEYTVNTQLLLGFLMNLADDPVSLNGEEVFRTPIFVTGNDMRHIYLPLIRHGRFDLYDWKPSIKTKAKIVSVMLNPYVNFNSDDEVERFTEMFDSQPISFFSSLRSDIIDDAVVQSIRSNGPNLSDIFGAMRQIRQKLSVDILRRFAEKRNAMRPNSYLTSG